MPSPICESTTDEAQAYYISLDKPFMIEITQDDLQSSSLWAKNMRMWNLDVVKRDEGCTSCSGVRCLDQFRLDTWTTFNKEDDHSPAFDFTADSEIIGKGPIGNPFLERDLL